MTQEVHVELNPGLPWGGKKVIRLEEDYFHQQTGLKCKEETRNVLHLEHNFVWC